MIYFLLVHRLRRPRNSSVGRVLLIILLAMQCTQLVASDSSSAIPVPLSDNYKVGDQFMGIKLLGTLRLPTKTTFGARLGGISALAWDEDADLLYALSDQGKLFHLRPKFSNEILHDVEIVAVHTLRDAKGQHLRAPWTDSEGLAIVNSANGIEGDSELIVSFEVKVRVVHYRPDGRWLKEETLPGPLRDEYRYLNGNKSLEAVTVHNRLGLLVAPELPLRGDQRGYIRLYAHDNRFWRYPLYAAPNSSLVAIEALPDDSVLTLERAFVSLTRPLIVTLRRTYLNVPPGNVLKVDDIAVFDSSQGWLLDNFEGLTRHRGRRFFIVSDDNQLILQNTLLVYFEMLAPITSGSG